MDSRDGALTESEREFVADFYRELPEVVEAAGARLPTPKEEANAKARDVRGADVHAKLIVAIEDRARRPPRRAGAGRTPNPARRNRVRPREPNKGTRAVKRGNAEHLLHDLTASLNALRGEARATVRRVRIAILRRRRLPVPRPRESHGSASRSRGSRRGATTRSASRGGDSGDGESDAAGVSTPPAGSDIAETSAPLIGGRR
jgi:hypothetical protein